MFSLLKSATSFRLNSLINRQIATKTLIVSNFNKSLSLNDIEGYCQSLLHYEDLKVFPNTNKFRLTVKSDDVNGAFHLLSNSRQLGEDLVVRVDYNRDERPKYKSLYVSNIPNYVEPEQLKEFFESEVTVLGCRMKKREGSVTCIAFVDVLESDFTKALFKFNLTKIDGREIGVSLYRDPNQARSEGESALTLFLTNISSETTLSTLFEAINSKVPVLALRFPKVKNSSIKTYTDAFCEIYKKDLAKALEILNKTVVDGHLLRSKVANAQTVDKSSLKSY
jgi:RNA recognition motif-containing protein